MPETLYDMQLTESQVIDLASGYCPKEVIAKARTLLQNMDDLRRQSDARTHADRVKAARKGKGSTP